MISVKFAEHPEFSACLSESDCYREGRETPFGRGGGLAGDQGGQVGNNIYSSLKYTLYRTFPFSSQKKSQHFPFPVPWFISFFCPKNRSQNFPFLVQKTNLSTFPFLSQKPISELSLSRPRFSEVEKFGALHKREEVPPLPDTTATICFSRWLQPQASFCFRTDSQYWHNWSTMILKITAYLIFWPTLTPLAPQTGSVWGHVAWQAEGCDALPPQHRLRHPCLHSPAGAVCAK